MFDKIKMFVLKHKLTFVGIAVGMLGGFLYWRFVGCASGTCMITSRPLNSTLYGGMMGGLLFSTFEKKEKIEKQ